MIIIGAKLKRLRSKNAFSQEFVAEKLGMSQPSYSKLEADKTSPSLKTIERVCDLYHLSLMDFLAEYDHAPEEPADTPQVPDPLTTTNTNEVIVALREQLQLLEQRIAVLEGVPKKATRNPRRNRRKRV